MDSKKNSTSIRFFQRVDTFIKKSKYVVSIIVFLAICLVGCVSDASSKGVMPVAEQITKSYIKLVGIENDTQTCEFQIFYGSDVASAFVFPRSKFQFDVQNGLPLSSKDLIIIKCCKGSFLPVFVQYGGVASGEKQEGFDGPFYLSMWLHYPQVPETSKTHIRCMVKSGTTGTVGVKIGNHGDYRFVAYENVHFVI